MAAAAGHVVMMRYRLPDQTRMSGHVITHAGEPMQLVLGRIWVSEGHLGVTLWQDVYVSPADPGGIVNADSILVEKVD